MTPLLAIATERIIGGSVLLVLVVVFVAWFLGGWHRMGLKPPDPRAHKAKRPWSQKERDDFEVLRSLNGREKK